MLAKKFLSDTIICKSVHQKQTSSRPVHGEKYIRGLIRNCNISNDMITIKKILQKVKPIVQYFSLKVSKVDVVKLTKVACKLSLAENETTCKLQTALLR